MIEIGGLAPAPFCGLILADFGADVIRVDRTPQGAGIQLPGINSLDFISSSYLIIIISGDIMSRGKKSVAINLKCKEGVELLLSMIEKVLL